MGEGPNPPRAVGPWVLNKHIGSGSFAVVWKARHSLTGEEVAVKEINTNKLNKKLKQSLECEVSVMQRIHHRNIVRLHETIEEKGRMYLVMEYCAGGDMAGYLRCYKRLPEAAARALMQQLGAGLKEMWSHHLVHRDLKPQNLLLSDTGPGAVLKIADFGFARNLQPQGLAETLCGSPLYMAPEILQFHKYDAKADLWSVGTILYELVSGRPPFTGANHVQLLRNIERNEARIADNIAAQLSPSCKHLIYQLLKRNPVERMSFEEFFSHPFLAPEGTAVPASPLTSPKHPTASPVAPFSPLAQRAAGSGGGARPSSGGSTPRSQGECLPFMLDADGPEEDLSPAHQPLAVLPPPAPQQLPVPVPVREVDAQPARSLDPAPAPMTPVPSEGAAYLAAVPRAPYAALGGSASQGSRGGGARLLEDSMDEDDYVIISSVSSSSGHGARPAAAPAAFTTMWHPLHHNPPPAAAAAPAPAARPPAAGRHNSLPPQRLPVPATAPAAGPGRSASLPPARAPEPAPLPLRLDTLEQVAHTLESIAAGRQEAGRLAEALALRLLALQLLSLALDQAPAAAAAPPPASLLPRKVGPGVSSARGAAAAGVAQEEKEAARLGRALKRVAGKADVLARALAQRGGSGAAGGASLPGAWDVAYEAGLELGRAAAVDELMGSFKASMHAYAKGAGLLYFMAAEAPGLALEPPLELSQAQRLRLHRYTACMAARHAACAAQLPR